MSEVQGKTYEEWSRFLADLHAELEDGDGLPGARGEAAEAPPAGSARRGAALRAGARKSPGAAAMLRALSLAVAVLAPATLGPAERLAVLAPATLGPERLALADLGPAPPARDEAPTAPRDPAPPPPPPAPSDVRLERADARVERVADRFETRSARLGDVEPWRLARVVVLEADLARIDPLLVLAVIQVESSFDVTARSTRGALGLMQLREPTLRREAERAGLDRADPFDPETNLRMGIRYLCRLLRVFGREELALMAYNAGPNRILAYLRSEGIPERFREYPRRVHAERRRLRRAYPELATASRLALR